MISFNQIPLNILTPGVYAEFDTSRAVQGVAFIPHDVLLVGLMISGSATAGQPYRIASEQEANALFGAHSQIAQMVSAYKRHDRLSALYAIGVANPSGTNATGSIVFAGTATEGGEIPIYIDGRRIPVACPKDTTAAALETAALAALAEFDVDLPVSYAANSGTGVDFTAWQDGPEGNQICMGVALREGERVPAGITVTVTQMSSGATSASYSGVITSIGEDQYATVAVAAQDATALGLFVTEYESRWGAMRAIEGQVFACKKDSVANLLTLSSSYNSHVLTIVGAELSALSPAPWEIAAQCAAISAVQAQTAPQIAMVGRVLPGSYAAHRGARFTRADRQSLLVAGIATVKAAPDGRLITDLLVTTYTANSQGAPDRSLAPVYRVRLLAAYRYSVVARFLAKFTDFSLGAAGDEVSGQPILTTSVARSELLSHYLDCAELGWVQKSAFKQFSEELLVQIDDNNPDRLNAVLPPNFINAFLVGAFKISFLQ